MLKTKYKILLAHIVQVVVMLFRQLFKLEPTTRVKRQGANWCLDLKEGIDFSIWLLGSFEPATARCLRRIIKPGFVVLDVGANIGAHTIPMAYLVGESGRVIAFEPTAYAYSKLCMNVEANPEICNRVKCLQAMLIDHDDQAVPQHLYSSWPLAQEKGLHDEHQGKLMPTDGAVAARLDRLIDDILPDRVDCIKLDIDGFETQMLRGAMNTLERWRPIIIMELAPYVLSEQGSDIGELLLILRNLGYSIYTLDGKARLPDDPEVINKMIPEGASLNVLAIVG